MSSDEACELCFSESEAKASNSSLINLNDLPVEVWLAVARFVPPEDLLTFCLLCRRTNESLQQPTFWINLYKRYRTPPFRCKGVLPQGLSLEAIKRGKGVRAKVIRALFRMYPPFNTRTVKPETHNLDHFIGRRCLGLWTKMTTCTSNQVLFLKLEDVARSDLKQLSHPLYANYEANNELLMVEGFVKQRFPSLKGLVLCHVSWRQVCVGEWFIKHEVPSVEEKLTLKFNDGQEKTEKAVITLMSEWGQKIMVSVVNWWNTSYPYPYLKYAHDRAMKKRIGKGKIPCKKAVSAVEESLAALKFWGESDEEDDW